ncbi:MAG: hypothetical protein AAF809_10475 [Bacteroidota bacterium]
MSSSIFRRATFAVALLSLVLIMPFAARAQVTIEVHGGVGYTAVDVDGWSQGTAVNWDQFAVPVYAQLFALQVGAAQLGLEVGYDYFFYYEVRIPDPFFTVIRGRDVEATRVHAVARLPVGGRAFVEAGAGPYFFDGFTNLGATLAVGLPIGLTPRLALPIKLRTGLVLDEDASLVPLSLSVGLSYRAGGLR